MGTQHKLSERQQNVLEILNAILYENLMSDEDLLSEEERPVIERLYCEAADSFAMGYDEVDKIIEQLQAFGYVDKNTELTVDGRQYIEVGYQPEPTENIITVNNIEQQKNINTKKYVERNAPIMQVDSMVKPTGISIENKGIDVGSTAKAAMQKIKNNLPK